MNKRKETIINSIYKIFKDKYSLEAKNIALRTPPKQENGDFCFPCFQFSKQLKINPNVIAEEINRELLESKDEKYNEYIEKSEILNGYINFFVKKESLIKEAILEIYTKKEKFGSLEDRNESVVIDYSSPNIAKPFSIGHLRSTIIGQTLKNILTCVGYKVYGVNHLGDWGTSFGKLVVAYEKWKDTVDFSNSFIKGMLDLYVKFHNESENDETLEQLARDKFTKLEQGDEEINKIWRMFVDNSLDEIKKIYNMLDIEFDFYTGESFYNKYLDGTVKRIEDKGITKISDGALIVDLEEHKMPPVLLKKKDGSTLYATRDMSAFFYRKDTFKPKKILYVVGSEQKLYWKQANKVLELLGETDVEAVHVDFGLYNFADKKMSTRKGNVIFLEDVLNEAVKRAYEVIEEKNANLNDPKGVAEKVGIGSIIFGDLVNDRKKNILFDWDKLLNFDGENAPYIQYSYVKIMSIFRKHRTQFEDLYKKLNVDTIEEYLEKVMPNIDYANVNSPEAFMLIRNLLQFKDSILTAAEKYMPSFIAANILDICKMYNKFYLNNSVLNVKEDNAEEIMNARLLLCYVTKTVLENGAKLLHFKLPQEM